jgi:hypothetical protein
VSRIGSEDCRVFATEGAEVVMLDVDREGAETGCRHGD